jgi:hypothetical protein
MASFTRTLAVLAAIGCAAAENQALRGSSPIGEVFNETTGTPSAEVNATKRAPDEMETLEALGLTNFALSSNACNIKCVYSDWGRGTCHGTTCECSGLKASEPLYLPNICQVPDVSSGDNSCNIRCVYSDWFRGTCSGGQCVCSGGKTTEPVPIGRC